MLKKAVKLIPFSTHTEIIPKFTSTTQNTTETRSNEYGEWESYSELYPSIWSIPGTSFMSIRGSTSTLKLPPRASFSFSRFRTRCPSAGSTIIYGVNAATKQWETIISLRGTGQLQFANVDGTKYYTEIKLTYTGHSNKYERGCFEMYNGTLKLN